MTRTFTLTDALALDDLHTFLSRASRVEDGSVRLIAGSGVLAVYVAVFYPVGLHDKTPTVLGLRTFALTDTTSFDAVVPVRSLLDRLARLRGTEVAEATQDGRQDPVTVQLPIEVNTVVWTAISPPRGGWHELDPMPTSLLTGVADAGIDEVRSTVGEDTGELIVRRVREEVWGRGIQGFEHVPAGAAFAAHALGFLASHEVAQILETGPWTRLTTALGHVLVRRRAWTLLG